MHMKYGYNLYICGSMNFNYKNLKYKIAFSIIYSERANCMLPLKK